MANQVLGTSAVTLLASFGVARVMAFSWIGQVIMVHFGCVYFLLCVTVFVHGLETIGLYMGGTKSVRVVDEKEKVVYVNQIENVCVEESSITARGFAWRLIITFALTAFLSVVCYIDTSPIAVTQVKIAVPKLNMQDVEGPFRLLHLSDIHIAPIVDSVRLQRLINQIEELAPLDLIVITGDLFDGPLAVVEREAFPLKQLSRLSKNGVYFVTGNHDYYFEKFELFLPLLKNLGITWLHNSHVVIDERFNLVGVDDWTASRHNTMDFDHGADMPKAIAAVQKDLPIILLAHNPNHIHEAAELGVDLQLSGHTHAGALFPLTLLNGLGNPYVYGLHDHITNGHLTKIYVTSGTFWWGPPHRWTTHSELVVHEL